MTALIGVGRRTLTGEAARRILGRCAFAAIGASFGAISISTFGADSGVASSRSITGPSQVMQAERRPVTVQPVAPADTKLDFLAAHVRMVDQLYEELMRWKPSGCESASTNVSMAGRC